jgi:hypothetical protein
MAGLVRVVGVFDEVRPLQPGDEMSFRSACAVMAAEGRAGGLVSHS